MMHHHPVRDVMTADPATVTPATPLRYVAGILVSREVSAVPVVSPQGKLLGIVTETDLRRKEELQRDPDSRHAMNLSYRTRRDIATAATAGELMGEVTVTVRPDADVADAARLMDRHGVACLPVVDESGRLLGVVTSAETAQRRTRRHQAGLGR